MLVSRLPAWGKKACLVASQCLMLFILGLLFVGALDQTRINWSVEAPASGLSVGIVHLAALVFAVLGAAVVVLDLCKVLGGKLTDDELVMIQESEEAAQIKQVLAEAQRAPGGTR
jgi:TRAP-type C4-dicarboxylate transport system permease small subunit